MESDSPKLYEVKLQAKVGEIVMDDLIDRFGFREIKVQGKEILLNEKKFRIKEYADMKIIQTMDVHCHMQQFVMILC